MLSVEEESIALSELFGIVTPDGLNFAIKLVFNKKNELFEERREFTLVFNEVCPSKSGVIIN